MPQHSNHPGIVMMQDAMRAMLDELMGKDRNVALNDRSNKQLTWESSEVCPYMLAGLCPNTLFKNTKSDLGERALAAAVARCRGIQPTWHEECAQTPRIAFSAESFFNMDLLSALRGNHELGCC
jgi:hypothetical protein